MVWVTSKSQRTAKSNQRTIGTKVKKTNSPYWSHIWFIFVVITRFWFILISFVCIFLDIWRARQNRLKREYACQNSWYFCYEIATNKFNMSVSELISFKKAKAGALVFSMSSRSIFKWAVTFLVPIFLHWLMAIFLGQIWPKLVVNSCIWKFQLILLRKIEIPSKPSWSA